MTPAKQIPEPGCIIPSCSYRTADQNIHECNVSHCVTPAGCDALDEARGRVSKSLTPGEAIERFRNTIENFISSLDFCKITRNGYGVDQRDDVIGIFIDFILFQEGLVNDRCFTVENSPDKYVAGKTISQERVEEIQSFLNDIFTERTVSGWQGFCPRLNFSFEDMLTDYLNKKRNVPNDVNPNVQVDYWDTHTFTYNQLLQDIFPFFKILLAGTGHFSELTVVFDFVVKFRQELVDSGDLYCPNSNLLTIALRTNNNNMREYFNRQVLDVIFYGRCDGIVNTMFDGCSLPTDSETTPVNRLNLKIGEELEYDILDRSKSTDSGDGPDVIFADRLKNKGLTLLRTDFPDVKYYGFDESFLIKPFYDTQKWFEINCTP